MEYSGESEEWRPGFVCAAIGSQILISYQAARWQVQASGSTRFKFNQRSIALTMFSLMVMPSVLLLVTS